MPHFRRETYPIRDALGSAKRAVVGGQRGLALRGLCSYSLAECYGVLTILRSRSDFCTVLYGPLNHFARQFVSAIMLRCVWRDLAEFRKVPRIGITPACDSGQDAQRKLHRL
jgi:hypothetical protein